jgi:2-polyprenyl-3-methyl-5-hydroxy-6-metoxy-1,4-benzoquinol methylase
MARATDASRTAHARDALNRFADMGYRDFQRLALAPGLSKYERIGFPDSYRKGYEKAIFDDIRRKLPMIDKPNPRVLDIGPGCSDLPRYIIEHVSRKNGEVILIDSAEMLSHLPAGKAVRKIAGVFPNCADELRRYKTRLDAIISYSVLQYVIKENSVFAFLDACLELLAPGGGLFFGDVPNISKRKRFLSSKRGRAFHKKFMKTRRPPVVTFNNIESRQVDDSTIIAMLLRARLAGFDAYVLPQAASLPMANRREDILVVRP